MTADGLQPKSVDLQRAMAYLIATARDDEARTHIWDTAEAEGRSYAMLAALAFITTSTADPPIRNNPVAILRLSRIVAALAAAAEDDA